MDHLIGKFILCLPYSTIEPLTPKIDCLCGADDCPLWHPEIEQPEKYVDDSPPDPPDTWDGPADYIN